MNQDEHQKIAGMKTAMHEAGAVFGDIMRRHEDARSKIVWLAEQGLPMAHLLPNGVSVEVPNALPLTLTMLGTAFGALASAAGTTAAAHEIARNLLLTGEPGVQFTGDDAPMMQVCADHLRVCYQRLRTMADDHAIEVLLEVIVALVYEVKPAIEGT